jgi:riboflavin kinase / FMN adenylyltransferase
MIIHTDIYKFKANKPVVTVGIFDGVHLGHKYILKKLNVIATDCGGESVIITLWPHPRKVLNQEAKNFGMLTSQKEKIRILEESGIQHLIILPFTREFSRLSGCEFIERILIKGIGIAKLVVGFNHRFGKDREGDFSALKQCADQFGFEIEKLDSFLMGDRNISSSEIRKMLLSGNVEEAAKLLGRDYSFSGQVVGGSQLGSSIGFPTANITPDDRDKLIPADGVYAVEALLKEETYPGMMNVGSRPTVNTDPRKRTIEVHLLDFDDNIYSENIQISFRARIREEQKFEGIAELKTQLEKDREETIRIFSLK